MEQGCSGSEHPKTLPPTRCGVAFPKVTEFAMTGKADSLKTILIALCANFAIFGSKLVAALLTGSGSMLAEAVHSLADCTNQGLLLIGMRQAKRKPTPDHPLGYGMATYVWSFLVALLLFSVGGMFSFYE